MPICVLFLFALILLDGLGYTPLHNLTELCPNRGQVAQAEIALKGVLKVEEESLVISDALVAPIPVSHTYVSIGPLRVGEKQTLGVIWVPVVSLGSSIHRKNIVEA